MREWIADESRVSGDTALIAPEGDSYAYVVYYVAPNREEWSVSIENTLRSDKASEYVEALAETVNVEDKKGNLNYLKVYAQREANAEAEAESSQEDVSPTETPDGQ